MVLFTHYYDANNVNDDDFNELEDLNTLCSIIKNYGIYNETLQSTSPGVYSL